MKNRVIQKGVSGFMAIVMLASLIFVVAPTQSVFAAGGVCTCVAVVKEYLGITESIGMAKDTGKWFLSHGWAETRNPVKGDIVVMQHNYPGAPSDNGHVGIFQDMNHLYQNKTTGETETPPCSNAGIVDWRTFDMNSSLIKFYTKDLTPGPWENGKSYSIKSVTSNLVLDVDGGNTKNETKIIQWEAHGGVNQIWKVEANPNGYFRLHSALSTNNLDVCLVVYYASKDNGGKIILNQCSSTKYGNDNELWKPVKTGNNYYILNQRSGKVMVIPSGSTVWGVQAIQWNWDGGPGQTWSFIQK